MKLSNANFSRSLNKLMVAMSIVGVVSFVVMLMEIKSGNLYTPADYANSARMGFGSRNTAKIGEIGGSETVTLWSSDFHISPIADIKNLLQDHNVKVIDKSLSGHCHLMGTCQQDLRVLTKDNGIDLTPCPNQLRREFYAQYHSDREFQAVDAFLCNHACSMCEVFMPFGKPMIVIASTRYEIGRWSKERWAQWNSNLQLIAANPMNTIAANNKYDQEYIKYFTGIDRVELLPNLCGYIGAKHSPEPKSDSATASAAASGRRRSQQWREEVLLAPARGINEQLFGQLFRALADFNAAAVGTPATAPPAPAGISIADAAAPAPCAPRSSRALNLRGCVYPNSNLTQDQKDRVQNASSVKLLQIVPIRRLYPKFEYSDLARHRAVVVLPYQLSFMSLFEYYRMQLPLLVPTPQLLADWHLHLGVLSERTWDRVFQRPAARSALPRHPNSTCAMQTDPNNEFSAAAVLEWVRLADFYQWPHVLQFGSWQQLFDLLGDAALLAETSRRMGQFNALERDRITRNWVQILDKVRAHKHSRLQQQQQQYQQNPSDYDDVDRALWQQYGYKLSRTDCFSLVYKDPG